MRYALILFAVCLSFQAILANSSDSKIAKLKEITAGQEDGIIKFNNTGYRYFSGPEREYELVVFLTADNCKLCEELYKEFELLVRLYQEEDCMEPKKEGDTTILPVFFGKIHFKESTKDIFRELGVRSAPDIIVNKPHFETLNEDARKVYLKKYFWQVMPSDGHVTAVKLLEYVNPRVNRNIVYREPITNLLLGIGILGLIFIGAIKAFLKYKSFFLNEKLWLFGSYAIMFICMSGVVYNIIHEVPLIRGDSWLSPRARTQTALEGYIMSATMLIVGLMLTAIQTVGHATGSSFRFFNTVVMITLLFGASLMMNFAGNVYYEKTKFYTTNFYPPAHYIKGPISRDQMNTI
mmetsp:Transcript_20034/g.23064  ORF Transcript_20034/g.23064 Transcript_20034/m.23064 type:complete len:350 (+) Transcript_20034:3-1052(+)